MRKHPCWGCHILQDRQTANKLWLCLCVVLSPPSLPFSLSQCYIFSHLSVSIAVTLCSSDYVPRPFPPPPPFCRSSVPSSSFTAFSFFLVLTSYHPSSPPTPILPPPSPPLLGHVAAAPAEIIGAKAWGCYLHRNSMTPQAASGEGHRDHLSQNFNENFCWDRDFFPSTIPPPPPPPCPISILPLYLLYHPIPELVSSPPLPSL